MSPSTPTAPLSIEPQPKSHLTRRLKSLQHERCSPKTCQHMEYAGKVTQESNESKAILYAIWLEESSMVKFLRKANFSLLQRNVF